jgi:cyclopropane-fatty-acyl-phospholipid synthase
MQVSGARHSKRRDRQAVSQHYDVGNDFYRIVLGESMVYSCAYWTRHDAGYGLADAQRDKLDLICRKLGLKPGMRLLDVGCGWGSLALHAAREYGVGCSASRSRRAGRLRPQAGRRGRPHRPGRDPDPGLPRPRRRAVRRDLQRRHGRARRHRPLPGVRGKILFAPAQARRPAAQPPDRPAAPAAEAAAPAALLHRRLRLPGRRTGAGGHDGHALEEAGFEVRDVQALREHYARTLRAWVANLEADWSTAVRLTSPGRARVWRLYMAASALAFEQARIGVNQVLA